eukprot:jgi/Chlat1/3530/Chrsp23S03703
MLLPYSAAAAAAGAAAVPGCCGKKDVMEVVEEGRDHSFPGEEERILALWEALDAFHEQGRRREREGCPEYVFYDGPPFATGLPHYGHILAGTIKDVVTRYASSRGHHVTRRFGWDCHGLPVEYEIDQAHNIKSAADVERMGIAAYNEACRAIVMRYSREWESTVTRLGRWIDFKNDYKTLDTSFMESVWWVFSQLFQKGLVYRGFKVMPYSTGVTTPLSNFEAGLNYKDVTDPAVTVAFPLLNDSEGAALLAWTTTPWTLPSNLALCVHPEFVYTRVKETVTGKVYILAECRLAQLPAKKPEKKEDKAEAGAKKTAKGKGSAPESNGQPEVSQVPAGYEIVGTCVGSDLAGRKYQPLFPYYADMKTAFVITADGFVTTDAGTGVVHCAPAFGEDDYRVCVAAGVIEKGGDLPCPVDDSGRFTLPVTDFEGVYVKEADKAIIAAVKAAGRLVQSASIVHSYPFCWRSDTPLLYRAVPSWFVAVETFKDRLLLNNTKTRWVPEYVQEKRFHNWLENARDWAISRSRYWGTPLPIWQSPDGEETVVVGSVDELEKLTGERPTDLHRHNIDHLTIPSKRGSDHPPLRRVPDVFDCWFESGSMPYASLHYPFENKQQFEENFPADFVAEGLDQTRGWFYTLMVLSTALFDQPAFKNLICNGLVLAADGKKMSKRLRNYPPPTEVVDKHGADALRLYLINSPVVRAEPLRFKEDGVFGVVRDVFLPWYNAYRFLVQQASPGFKPLSDAELGSSPNVLDRWMRASWRALARFVRAEMEAYRLFTVVPRLVQVIEDLTNTYVRLNRSRLKGKSGDQKDQAHALGTLYDVLLHMCIIMAPFTPFFVESVFQNLRRVRPELPESVHYCDFPVLEDEETEDDARMRTSVRRMQTVLELGRTIRERHNRPLKTPLKEMVIVHPDQDFLADIAGTLQQYVLEELNVKVLTPCSDPLQYATLRAEPDFATLGPKLGKGMGLVTKAVKALDQAAILRLQESGSIELQGHTLTASEIKVVREFKPREGTAAGDMDAAGDGDVLVVLDLRADQELLLQGVAREAVNRVQKLRKKAGLLASDKVDVFYAIHDSPPDAPLRAAFEKLSDYMRTALNARPVPLERKPKHAVRLATDKFPGVGEATLEVVLTRTCVMAVEAQLLDACGGDRQLASDVMVVLVSRDPAVLALEKDVVVRVGDRSPVMVRVDEHFVLAAGELPA